jgi:hypothetical protein
MLTHQLGPDAVGRFERARVQEVVVTPIGVFLLLLVRMISIQQREVVACTYQTALLRSAASGAATNLATKASEQINSIALNGPRTHARTHTHTHTRKEREREREREREKRREKHANPDDPNYIYMLPI